MKLSSIDLPEFNGQKWAWAVGEADHPSIDPNASAPTDDEITLVESNLGMVDANCDPSLNACTTP